MCKPTRLRHGWPVIFTWLAFFYTLLQLSLSIQFASAQRSYQVEDAHTSSLFFFVSFYDVAIDFSSYFVFDWQYFYAHKVTEYPLIHLSFYSHASDESFISRVQENKNQVRWSHRFVSSLFLSVITVSGLRDDSSDICFYIFSFSLLCLLFLCEF